VGFQIRTNAPKNRGILSLLSKLAGDESLNWHPLISDFVLIGQKLQELGFIYSQGRVIVLNEIPSEEHPSAY